MRRLLQSQLYALLKAISGVDLLLWLKYTAHNYIRDIRICISSVS